ncbi:MAG: type II secretion system protein GspF, partial [Desulfobacteraceae bacterium]
QDLTALLKAGLPVDRSLKILVQASENPAFQEIVKQILNTIEGGIDLSEALSRHPRVFSEFYVNMVKAGEAGGILEHVLERMGIFLETSQELKDFITSAMVYPLFLIFVGGASIIVLMTFVIPKFSVMFADMGDAIPLSTRILLDASTLFRDFWWAGLIGCLLLFFSGRRYLQTPNGRIRFDRLKMKVPMVGDVVRKVEVSRITRTLGTLIDSGVPILRAIVLVKDIISNKVIASRMDEIHDRVKEGERLSVPLEQTTIFPPLALHMIRVGEETGNLSGMLLKVADNYEKTVKNGVKRVVGLLEPVMILMMGCIVGFIVISMLMAIFSMNEMPM